MKVSEPAALNTFISNMTHLWRLDPALALALDRIDDENLPDTTAARSSIPTIAQRTVDGRDIFLHSKYDPAKEAQAWADHNYDDDKICYFVEGIGLGYHIRALFDKLKGDTIIIAIEPDVALIRLSLTVHDFSTEIHAGRLVILHDPNKEMIHHKLGGLGPYIMMGTKFAAHGPSAQVAKPFFDDMRAILMDFVGYTRVAMVTLVLNSLRTCENVASNLPTYLSTPPINELKSKFGGYPAIVVSAGPSLRKNVHLLQDIQDHAVIIATQTTFKPLLNRGITPHFVCSLDYHEMSKHYYEGVDDFRNVHLVAEPKAHHSVIDHYAGPVSLLSNDFAKLCLGQTLHGERGGLRAGSSVAHLAFYLAEYMGCDPVILIGQDLALTDHVYYAPGMSIHAAWQPELNRFCTMEMKEWERIMRNKRMLKRVEDHQGHEIYTEDLMFNYLEQFEKDFTRTHVQVIDASEGGARKRGCKTMSLRQAIAEFCTQLLPPNALDYRQRRPWRNPDRLAQGRQAIETRIGELSNIQSLCDDTLAVLSSLERLIAQPLEFNRKIKEVDRLRVQIKEYDAAYEIIIAGAQLAEFKRFSADRKMSTSSATGVEMASLQLKRDNEFVNMLKRDAGRMIEVMERALHRFDAHPVPGAKHE